MSILFILYVLYMLDFHFNTIYVFMFLFTFEVFMNKELKHLEVFNSNKNF